MTTKECLKEMLEVSEKLDALRDIKCSLLRVQQFKRVIGSIKNNSLRNELQTLFNKENHR